MSKEVEEKKIKKASKPDYSTFSEQMKIAREVQDKNREVMNLFRFLRSVSRGEQIFKSWRRW